MVQHRNTLLRIVALLMWMMPMPAFAQTATENSVRITALAEKLQRAESELRSTRSQLQELRLQASGGNALVDDRIASQGVGRTDATNRFAGHRLGDSVGQLASIPICDSCSGCGTTDCLGVDVPCACCNSQLSWSKGKFQIIPFGTVTGEMVGSNISPQLRGSPLFLLPAPAPGIDDSRFTTSAQQSTVGMSVTGPNLGSFESSAVVAVNFFGEQPIQNNPGLFFMLAYAQLRNEDWRFWVGQDGDGIGRQNTNAPAWSSHKMQGNFGQLRPGFRAERSFQHSAEIGSSLYVGLTQQAVNDFIAVQGVSGIDNGWPNVEARWELAMGAAQGGQRPFQFSVGGLLGETRAIDDFAQSGSNVSTTWAVIPELRLEGQRFGFQGEAFVGQAMGTYNGAIGQSLNPIDGEPIYGVGGFGEVFCKMTPSFTTSVGAGVDDPRDSDLGTVGRLVGQRSRNESYWVNFIWNLSEEWETRFEVSHLETTYIGPSDDSASMLYHGLVRYSF